MILQSLKGYNRFKSLIIHFATILRIIEDENRLRQGDKYLYILASFIYCIQVLFVEYILLVTIRAEQIIEDIDWFLILRKKYLIVRSYNPYSFLIKILGYKKTISIQKINQLSITQTRLETSRPDGDILEFHRKLLLIKRFKDIIHNIIKEAKDILQQDLIQVSQQKDYFEINLDKI